MGPAPMEGIERTNAVVVRSAGQGAGVPPRRDPYAMEVDWDRNCYACGGFGHMAYNCRNRRRIMRRVEIGGRRFEGNIEQIRCCGNHLSQRQMITQTVNLLVGYQVGNSQENSTRSLC